MVGLLTVEGGDLVVGRVALFLVGGPGLEELQHVRVAADVLREGDQLPVCGEGRSNHTVYM